MMALCHCPPEPLLNVDSPLPSEVFRTSQELKETTSWRHMLSPRVREWARVWELGELLSSPIQPLPGCVTVGTNPFGLSFPSCKVFPGFSDLITNGKHRQAVQCVWLRGWVLEPDCLYSNQCPTTDTYMTLDKLLNISLPIFSSLNWNNDPFYVIG